MSWSHTFIIGMILGVGLSVVLVFLQPFDTAQFLTDYKTLLLWGYGLCCLIPVLLLHPLENALYTIQKQKWYVLNELGYVIVSLLFIFSICYFYNTYVVNSELVFSWKGWRYFMLYYGLPFMPILGPIWLYFRNRFGKISILQEEIQVAKQITIQGDNKSENLVISNAYFVYAQAQQNYVTIYYMQDDKIRQKMMRSTLSNLQKQLPDAWQVHRSFLVNLAYLQSISGNSRKRTMQLTVTAEAIPISQKYYEALLKRDAISSQNMQ
jgi:hypothetical protein